ncbi:Biotin synthase [Pseudobythopirellula maris]|uniref:Biotin synthase n=1 Tax=Pseudobythopirellula maris TaxID=2527991 RepID=A0A5C5ZIR7_9BACT|nr:biotin synthase BioB [Pseudobythopirellula maris]TWT86897.1 Biotin synthase [Pseudobythopirellula maris]
MTALDTPTAPPTAANRWQALAEQSLRNEPLSQAQAMEVLACPDDELLLLLDAAYRVRREHFGRRVQLYFLMNAKSGLCPEDCGYCSQSKISDAEIPKYNLLNKEKLLDGARLAAEREASTYCIVISARGPSEREVRAVEEIVPEIKRRHGLKVCACLGLLSDAQAERLKAAGVDRVNHNLNTSESHYEKICTTHTYKDRVDTLRSVRTAGMEVCSGGIIGMGERPEDVADMAIELRGLEAESIPVNFLNPIDGTPLEGAAASGGEDLNPRKCLKVLAMFRLVCPRSEIRIAGGREIHLRSLQAMGLYAANSLFVGDYLTTEGQPAESDYQMLEDLGFEVVISEAQA